MSDDSSWPVWRQLLEHQVRPLFKLPIGKAHNLLSLASRRSLAPSNWWITSSCYLFLPKDPLYHHMEPRIILLSLGLFVLHSPDAPREAPALFASFFRYLFTFSNDSYLFYSVISN